MKEIFLILVEIFSYITLNTHVYLTQPHTVCINNFLQGKIKNLFHHMFEFSNPQSVVCNHIPILDGDYPIEGIRNFDKK